MTDKRCDLCDVAILHGRVAHFTTIGHRAKQLIVERQAREERKAEAERTEA